MAVFDVAVIGAGIAGLSCAQQLSQAGYTVVVVEKSRGLGGRIATRRLHSTCADHGLRYLEQQGHLLQQLIQVLCERHLLQVWTDTVYEYLPDQQQLKSATQRSAGASSGCCFEQAQFPRYVAPDGMCAIAKFLATGLDIWLNQRVEAVVAPAGDDLWHLCLETSNVEASGTPQKLTARAVVIAIPAPQALMLLEPLAKTSLNSAFLDNLRAVEFDPCLSVIAGYSSDRLHQAPDWKAVTFVDDPDLAWIGLDSSKRMVAKPTVFVVQSSAGFAKRYLEAQDLHPPGRQLLDRAAQYLLSWLNNPDWMQVHRWRYAFPSHSWHETCLSASGIPLVCCGDWCGGASSQILSMPSGKLRYNQVESAMISGLAAATEINSQLQQRTLPGPNFFTKHGEYHRLCRDSHQ